MQPRLVQVSATAEDFAPLFGAASAAGVRIGWLDLAAAPAVVPELAAAAEAGALRAVSVSGAHVLSLKTLAGEPVLGDVIREHFTGCRLLLVRGEVDAPRLSADPDGWRVRPSGGDERLFSTEELLNALRSPNFP